MGAAAVGISAALVVGSGNGAVEVGSGVALLSALGVIIPSGVRSRGSCC